MVRLEGLQEVTGRDLALLAVDTLYRSAPGQDAQAREALEAAARRWCPTHAEAIIRAKLWDYDGCRRAGVLADAEPLALVRLVLWAVLSRELRQRVEYDRGEPGRADWYLGTERIPSAPMGPAQKA